MVAPAWDLNPKNAPVIFPFLFITIACGAVSGFHCLVSSGTSSKQLKNETDARFVGYGSMLTEGFLATLVIIACGAGLGLGLSIKMDPYYRPSRMGRTVWRLGCGRVRSLPRWGHLCKAQQTSFKPLA